MLKSCQISNGVMGRLMWGGFFKSKKYGRIFFKSEKYGWILGKIMYCVTRILELIICLLYTTVVLHS